MISCAGFAGRGDRPDQEREVLPRGVVGGLETGELAQERHDGQAVAMVEVDGCYEAANRRWASAYYRRLTRLQRHVDVGSSSASQKREAMRSHGAQSAKFPEVSLRAKKT